MGAMKNKAMAEAESVDPTLYKALLALYYSADFECDCHADNLCDCGPDGTCAMHVIEAECLKVERILNPNANH